MAQITCYCRVMMPLRDGVRLATDIYLPDAHGRFPVIVIRSPYNGCATRSEDALTFARAGLGMVIQDCRGTGQSEGTADLWRQERDDAEDFFNWISEQEWFDGNLVTNGESYPGGTQWQAARLGHRVMKGLTPHNAPLNVYASSYYPGGAYGYGIGAVWAFGMLNARRNTKINVNWQDARYLLPLRELDTKLGFGEWPLWREWMAHPSYDGFWRSANAFEDIGRMTAPAFITGGWFDAFIMETLRGFTALRERGATEKARRFTRCVIEPLDHDMRTADIDYGPNHLNGIIATRNRFMKNIVTNPDSDPLPDQPVMRFFVMGSNRWQETDEWPLRSTRDRSLFLCGKEAANSILGGGTLSFAAPQANEHVDTFVYNPLDPVPTLGGNNLGYALTPPGQREQSPIEKRTDVLVYTGEPLDKDTDVIGYVKAVIYASTTAADTDFTVKLCDVYPDGRSYNVCDGLLRGRYRNGNEREELLEPGRVYAFTIDCWVTAMTFRRGHRIRVQVSSSNFPRFDRNPNTGAPFGTDDRLKPAEQHIFHSAEYPSRVVLPILEA